MVQRSPLVMVLLLANAAVYALDNGAARTPPMGWSTWNKLKCNFNESTLLEVSVLGALPASGDRASALSSPLLTRARVCSGCGRRWHVR